jgi:hypothetical protein
MNTNRWAFANLNNEQLELVKEGENTLGAEYLLAYVQDEKAPTGYVELFIEGLMTAPLDDSQLECLAGLEERLNAVVVAYRNPS